MRVLVTGHEGYIGTVLVPLLQEAGHEVTGLDTGLFAPCLLGPAPAPVPTARTDLRDVQAMDCQGHDAVIHLAALSNDPVGNLDPELTYDINYRSTVALARAARQAGVARFLFSSSCSLYGAGPDDKPLTESAGFAPVTAYGESKIRAERALLELAEEGFSPVFLRNATAYGYSPRLRGDLVVNDLVANALLSGQVRLRSDGQAWRPLVHVADIAAAFVALLEVPRERMHATAYNVGQTTENYRIIEVAQIVTDLVPGSEIVFSGDSAADKRNYRVSCDLIAAQVPEFSPRWTLRDGVGQLVDAYRSHGLTREAFDSERYQRLRRIEALRQAGQLDSRLRWVGNSEPAAA
ncbi:MAG: SDR family oxidoreductase [Streptosporangiaceae bacterium]|nr:SDR family oxidoreductase [Streptosporangiaceae bacterium]